jgi:hypothetical protein
MNKKCKNCGNDFEILEEDQEFYKMMDVDAPTHCYLCRTQRRLSYRNERFLYNRKCDLTGKKIISSFSEDKNLKVYDIDAWWSDEWSPLNYGRDFDFSRPFFEQFFELRDLVPRLCLQQQKPMINSEYCNCASQDKNCYLVFSNNRNEDCYYGSWVNDCKDCVDNFAIFSCELCYDCSFCNACYSLNYSQYCTNCKSSYFLKNCLACSDCFACSNLHNKQYCIFNKQKTREEYEKFIKQVDLGNCNIVKDGKEKAQKMLSDLIVKEFVGINIENCLGNYIYNSKNAYLCFECDNVEDCRYSCNIEMSKSSMDHSYWGVGTERIYDCHGCGYDDFNLRFCNLCWSGCSDLTYCDQCFSSKKCFGSVGLKKQEYCILNKQYKEKEYEDIVRKIIEHMKKTGEWSEFFPVDRSVYAYNETLAQERIINLTKEEVIKKGWQWKDKDPKEYQPQKYNIPDNIKETKEDIINTMLSCEVCEKNYKIIDPELKFYKKQNIPCPRKCQDCRHKERLIFKLPNILFDRKCGKCSKPIKTAYSKDNTETVYCEKCYLETVM